MKKSLRILAIVLVLTMFTPITAPDYVVETIQAASKVKLNYAKKTIYQGKTFKLRIMGTTRKVKWKSSDTNVATVSSKGSVKGISVGNCNITASVAGKKYVCRVMVKQPKYIQTFVEGKKIFGADVGVDENLVGAFFTFTNNSGKTVMPCEAIDIKAYQHGVEIPVLVLTGDRTEGAIQCDTNVQSGVTANVVWLFQIEDDSTVTLECSDGQKIDIPLK